MTIDGEPKVPPPVGVAFARVLIARLVEWGAWTRAAAMAFWVFLATLPLTLIAGLATTALLSDDTRTCAALRRVFHLQCAANPTTGSGAVTAVVREELHRVSRWNASLVAVGASLAFLWLASNAVLVFFDGVAARTTPQPITRTRRRMRALACTALLAIACAVLALIVLGVSWIIGLAGARPDSVALVEGSSVASGSRIVIGGALWFG
jgi:uncharacterized BrkB/YihY/UPF0761 family membrane protein